MKTSSKVKVKCFMCKKRNAKPLEACRDGMVYINACTDPVFCSMKCSSNYGLLWGTQEIANVYHFCPSTGDWESVEQNYCRNCNNNDGEES